MTLRPSLRSILALTSLVCANTQLAATPTSDETFEATASALLEQALPDPTGPGLAVLVARGDTVLFRAARGMASLELGVPLTPEHVFRIGSVTKQFAAAGLLRLVDDGKLSLDDPLSQFLPDYPGGDAITVAHLLNHTVGIQSYTSIPGYMDQEIRKDLDTEALIAVFKDQPVEFAPGQGWTYNNSGYVLVGAVIEKASGMPWARWLEQSQFQPLGLGSTRSGDTREIIPGHADGYSSDANGRLAVAAPLSMSQPHAAGALVSTVDDLLRWNRALHGGEVISQASYQRMITPEGKAGAAPNRYGFGIQAGQLRGRDLLEHGGGINGFVSTLLYLPEAGITVAVLRNTDGAGARVGGVLARRLAALALGDPYPVNTPIEVPEPELRALEGVYRLDADTTRTLRVRDGVLTSQRSGGPVFPLIPTGNDGFGFEESLSRLVIERDAEGAPVAVRFFAEGEGEGELWPRSEEAITERAQIELSRAQKDRLIGNYVASQLSFRVFLDNDNVLRVQVPGQPALALQAQTASQLFLTEVDARLEFAPDTGVVETATLFQGPAQIVAERQGD